MSFGISEVVAAVTLSFVLGYTCRSPKFARLFLSKKLKNIDKTKMVLIVRSDLGMNKGKIASQCSHATAACYKKAITSEPEILALWEGEGQPKICVAIPNETQLKDLAKKAAKDGLIASLVRDAGRTQVVAGSITACGIGPGCAKSIDRLTSSLKLL